jgi:hypothetical protein
MPGKSWILGRSWILGGGGSGIDSTEGPAVAVYATLAPEEGEECRTIEGLALFIRCNLISINALI